jgi:quinol-cytochrome oxidoreductase complex cytochrome b subunit
MKNSIDKQRFPANKERRELKYVSHDRLMAMTSVVASILAFVLVMLPIGLLYFNHDTWSNAKKFYTIPGWMLLFWLYLAAATNANTYEAVTATAR